MDRRTLLTGFVGAAGVAGVAGWSARRDQARSLAAGPAAKAAPPRAFEADEGRIRGTLRQFPLGGGGFVTGIDVSSDGGRLLCRTDVANAYVRDQGDASWRPLFSPETMLPGDYDPLPKLNGKADGQGVAGVRIAPSNRDVIFASYYGYVWKSVDGGRTVRRTAFRQAAMPSNAGLQRLFNRTIDIHPRNPDHVVVGTCGEGAFATRDGGRSWSSLALPPAGKSNDDRPGIHLVLFDPASPDSVYVFVAGVGLHRSQSGVAGDFRAISGGPKQCTNLAAGPEGSIFLCEQTTDNSGKIWRLDSGDRWGISDPDQEASVIALDPRDPQRVVASNPNGHWMTSSDGGRSFSRTFTGEWGGGEIAWTDGLGLMFPAQILFDPAANGEIWVAQGVGVVKAIPAGSGLRLSDRSAGIEELCIFSMLAPPGGPPIAVAWDKPFWRLAREASYSNDFRYPLTKGQQHNPSLVVFASYCDYAGDDPRHLVGVVAPTNASAPGFSIDGGQSWQAFATTPESGWGHGGCIAASTKENVVLLPSNNGTGVYTLDGGNSWAPIRLDGSTPTSHFANAFYVARKNVTADKTRPGHFALVYTMMAGSEVANPLGGLWLSADGGRNWRQAFTGVIGEGSGDPRAASAAGLEFRQFWQCQLDYVPGRQGELVYTPHADFGDDRLYWSQDDGRSWKELHKSIRNVTCFGFGKAAAGQERPALYFWGDVKGKRGLYGSTDWFASGPRLISRFPSAILSGVSSLAGDLTAPGRLWLGTGCGGVVQVDVSM